MWNRQAQLLLGNYRGRVLSELIICGAIGAALGPSVASLAVRAPRGRSAVHLDTVIGAESGVRRVVISTVASAVVCASVAGLPPRSLPAVLVVALGGVILVQIDIAHHRLPDLIVLPAAVGFSVLTAVARVGSVLPMALTGLAFFVVFFGLALLRPDGVGFGDVKLAGLIGVVIGALDPELTIVWILATSAASLVWVLALLAARKATLRSAVAFGPPMLVGLWAVLLL